MTHVHGTTPYAWPYDAVIDPHRTAIVATGWDHDTARSIPRDVQAEANMHRLADLRSQGLLLVTVEHLWPNEWRSVNRTTESDPLPLASDHHITAAGIDGFYGSPLDALLQRSGRTHLLLIGYGLESTVHSTLRRANDRGYECLLVADACVAVDPSLRDSAVSQVEMSGGIFGAVGVTASVIAAYGPPRASSDT